MRLQKIQLRKLFRLFDHDIPLNMDDRITIIHSPNGFGKTAILRMIAGLFNRRHSSLWQLPFQSLATGFDDGTMLTVTKPDGMDPKPQLHHKESLVFKYPPHAPFDLREVLNPKELPFSLGMLDNMIPELMRTGPQEWVYGPTNETLDLQEVLTRFGDRLPIETRESRMPKWLTEVSKALPVHFIQANRLERIEESERFERARIEHRRPVLAAAKYATELASRIQETLAEYAALSQSLDRSFPRRLVMATGKPALTRSQVNTKLSELENKRTQLTEAGVLDKEEHSRFDLPTSFDESKIDVLSVYIADAERKLGVFDDLFSKISLFKTLIEPRLRYKTFAINKTDGIAFSTRDGQPLLPGALSTGEQHEIVLLYELLFKVTPNSLILIDEPEISLHIAWQEQFLSDLQRMIALSSFDVIVATHSPQIISNRWDLAVELRGPA